MDSRAQELVRIGKKLFTEKQDWDNLCQDIGENFYPARADFTSTIDWEDFAGGLFESYPVMARETLANNIQSMLRQGEWFEVRTGNDEIDEIDANARALDYATRRLRTLVLDPRAQFSNATIEADHDWVAFGNPVLSVEESQNRDHLVFRAHHPRDAAWLVNADGRVDHLHKRAPMQARSVAMKRGWNVPEEVKRIAEKNPSAPIKIQHVVCPFDLLYGDDRQKRIEARGMPFRSLYIDMEREEVLFDGALPVFNYVVPRWRSLSGRAQGFSPATMNALPDGRMLQSMARIILEQGEKAVDPPLVAKGDIFRNDELLMYAGGMTYADLEEDARLQDAIMTLDTSRNVGIGLELKQDVRSLMAEAFLLNKLFLPNAREMREIEVQVRTEEFRRAALPFFSPIESEYHAPLLEIAFSLAVNRRAIDFEQFPEDLQGRDVEFTFFSPLNTAEGRLRVAAFQETVQLTAASAQFDNTIPSMLDFQKMTKDAVRGTGAEPDWFKSDRQVADEQARIRQAEALAATAAALREGAGVAGEVGAATQQLQAAGLV